MQSPLDSSANERLDRLFCAYRQAVPDPEPSVNFMPELWQRIESRQRFASLFRRVAGGMVTAAVALTLVMAISVPGSRSRAARNSEFYSQTYVEALADSHAADNQDFYEPLHADIGDDTGPVDLL